MKLKAWDTNGNFLGGVMIESGITHCAEGAHETLQSAVNELQKNGVYTYYGDRKLYGKQSTVIQALVPGDDPLYPLAVRDTLVARGLRIDIDAPEIDQHIREELSLFPYSEERKDLLERLDSMRILEKSFLLEKLKTFNAAQA